MAEPIPAKKRPMASISKLGRTTGGAPTGASLCDGSHKSVGLAPQKFRAIANKPFCDGSHKRTGARQ
jgi:CDGSH-type Zn-finger protein